MYSVEGRKRAVRRGMLLAGGVIGGGAVLAGVIAAVATSDPNWGFAAVFLWIAVLTIAWVIAILMNARLRKSVFSIYALAWRRRRSR